MILTDQILLGLVCLKGKEWVDFLYYDDFWRLLLATRGLVNTFRLPN